MSATPLTDETKYVFRVVRWVRESYEVTIVSKEYPTMKQVEGAVQDPHAVTVERQTIQQIFP